MIRSLWWIVHKDLVCELRARLAWPVMLLSGIVVTMVFCVQLDLLPDQRPQLLGGLLWLAVFFAGMTAVDRSFLAESENGCWEGLKSSPTPSWILYLAKLTANFLALTVLELVLMPLFFVLADVPLAPCAGSLPAVALAANLGLSAVGTLVGALAVGGRAGETLVLLVLPVSVPVVLAAAECTRLSLTGPPGEAWWRWFQLLVVFGVVFTTAGTLLFEYAIEE